MAPSGGLYMLPSEPYNEVYPNLYVGDGTTALSTEVLIKIGITHVLNAAQGKGTFYYVNTNAEFYEEYGIKFLGVPAIDMVNFQLKPYFEQAANFIDDGIKSNGKVFVHCREGVSRSVTLALAYLMIKKGMTAQEAMRAVRAQREVVPNDGFLQQLCDLNEELQREKHLKDFNDGVTQQ